MLALRQHLIRPLARLWSVFSGPRILYGWRNGSGVYCAHTRYSTHTSFEDAAALKMGDYVYLGHFNRIDASNGLVIEEGVQFTNYISVLSHSSHRSVRVMGRAYFEHPDPVAYVRRPTHIGAYSFIGPHCVIAPGARLGKGVIVQGYSFVAGDVPDFAIVGPGAPGQRAQVLGDTRQLDGQILAQHPEWQVTYAAWAGQQALSDALSKQKVSGQ